MPNQALIKQGKEMAEAEELLRLEYAKLAGSPVLADILRLCAERYDAELLSATLETANPHKSASALQRAHAYDIIRTYIQDKM